ncbi:hypothetical protein TanjilG_01315 [Lupinus angustifolius]|uniref:Rho-GAP domain-containing protein n=1 Tax=Lupinus angustifolius TaxID=3871 RepID=A0A4P1REL0_LUPAN|nr:PREDICTED: rho GTPase-activating protein 5-like [Lupinus angustifolius]OIW09344.1 hypothetical protein TanjilG_01315 [Lupinus angustifolius]
MTKLFHSSSSSTTDQTNNINNNNNNLFFILLFIILSFFLLTLLTKLILRWLLFPMDIGFPTNVRHVAHVTFDRFNGFLGLPAEFEPDMPTRPPSASATVFGVSTESMQLSFDSRGNSVPTILLLMQTHLYAQEGLQAEGIFRINADNSHEEYVRDQLNLGSVPDGIDVHCLAGQIKAWFRELPMGVLDPLSQEQVMQCQSEEECVELVKHLPNTEAALLDWAINLMADVVEHQHLNKMNAHNIAMVFAPNMTQMADPFTALVYAVQVMNFLKTLITRTLQERKDSVVESSLTLYLQPLVENASHSILESCKQGTAAENEDADENIVAKDTALDNNSSIGGESKSLISSYCECPPKGNMAKSKTVQSSSSSSIKGSQKTRNQKPVEKIGIRSLDSKEEKECKLII